MPMKILWALLDLATIVVLGSGLYLWIRKPAGARKKAARTADGGKPSADDAQDPETAAA
mgnify:CR=1 FL=1